jgi:hypothetical protein
VPSCCAWLLFTLPFLNAVLLLLLLLLSQHAGHMLAGGHGAFGKAGSPELL